MVRQMKARPVRGPHPVSAQENADGRIVVGVFPKKTGQFDVEVQLFFQFANERLGFGFPGIDFAPRKFEATVFVISPKQRDLENARGRGARENTTDDMHLPKRSGPDRILITTFFQAILALLLNDTRTGSRMLSQGFSLNHFSRLNFVIWCSLAFQAGAINAGGFLASHRFVSHVTGFATLFGSEMAFGHWTAALWIMTVPGFFITGGIVSALFIDRRLSRNRRPQYTQVIFLVGLVLIAVAVLGSTGQFSRFGESLDLSQDYKLLALLCLACGMQNAAVTSASGAVIRTTHLTGITTDLSIGLVRIFSKHLSEDTLTIERRKAGIRIGLIGSFIAGSLAGSVFFLQFEYLGFLFPATISVVMSFMGILFRTSSRGGRKIG